MISVSEQDILSIHDRDILRQSLVSIQDETNVQETFERDGEVEGEGEVYVGMGIGKIEEEGDGYIYIYI